jgi:hypothetical protein
MKRAREAAEEAAEHARHAADQAKVKAGEVSAAATRTASDPATQARFDKGMADAAAGARGALGRAKKGLTTVVEKIDPGVLADLIIKATALQERTNDALRARGSLYRISEVDIQASIPPGVTFAITRLGEPERPPSPDAGRSSEQIVASSAEGDGTVVALDGSIVDEEPEEAPETEGPARD